VILKKALNTHKLLFLEDKLMTALFKLLADIEAFITGRLSVTNGQQLCADDFNGLFVSDSSFYAHRGEKE